MVVHFTTAYDEYNRVIGRAHTFEKNGKQCISKRTYNRLMKHRTIGGIAGIMPVEPVAIHVINTNGTEHDTIGWWNE